MQVTIEGMDRVVGAFGHVEQSLDDLSPLFERFGEQRYGEEKQLFEDAPWPALSPATEARKAQLFGGPSQILVATGRLRSSFTEKGAPDNVHRVERKFAEFGSVTPYGVFHIPKRDPRAEPDADRYLSIAEEWMAETLKEAGFN